ncbi:energy-coupling factor ABC transporter ATP-binding protein [Clostridium tyrobutyricum]|jgi:energy-coupling factor transport system ATP-binding protein|uniref:energy-coupling factor ABC transporter ATP-binding protein n=1 Tax=Clostridium tyrobutyricum TaxID=1519 RepID=UPI001C3852B1|nr:ATP-binding cassette domain-containing protein [Clostridium tyrobutyricum]MBV4427522.1 energy-coupling factor ABC transporter ATP-binding protein [Clostridium tyrobutyricum]MBV4442741.1 energy-coupling factor ABC transporter ATP-binding protein [Clostridium tyrobutyricum]
MQSETVIEVKDMHFAYKDGTEAIKGINLNIHKGEFIALIGQNGAGKTTFAKTLNGLLKPTEGYVKCDGIDTNQKGVIKKLVKKVGYVFQNPDHQLFNTRVDKEIAYAPINVGFSHEEVEKRVTEAAAVAGIREEHMKMHPFFLPKGLRQRVSIASILALKPKVIIVDEPTTGQDYKQSIEIMNFLKELNENQGHTIIIITHEMDIVAKYCKRLIVLCHGKILMEGSTKEVFSKPDLLENTFVKPPEVTQLAQALGDFGLSNDILSIDELWKEFSSHLGGEKFEKNTCS